METDCPDGVVLGDRVTANFAAQIDCPDAASAVGSATSGIALIRFPDCGSTSISASSVRSEIHSRFAPKPSAPGAREIQRMVWVTVPVAGSTRATSCARHARRPERAPPATRAPTPDWTRTRSTTAADSTSICDTDAGGRVREPDSAVERRDRRWSGVEVDTDRRVSRARAQCDQPVEPRRPRRVRIPRAEHDSDGGADRHGCDRGSHGRACPSGRPPRWSILRGRVDGRHGESSSCSRSSAAAPAARARLEPELLRQAVSRPPQGVKRLGLPPRAGQRQRQLAEQPFLDRVSLGESF